MKQHLNKEGVLNKLAMFLLFILCKEVKNTKDKFLFITEFQTLNLTMRRMHNKCLSFSFT